MRDKKILVTGGRGFLGQHVVCRLAELGYTNVAVPSSRQYDLRVRSDVTRLFDYEKPGMVIHLAANCGGIGKNAMRPADLLYDNAIMGLELLEAAKDFKIEKFLTVGTVCSYPKFCPTPFKEDDLWNGYPEETNAPYGIAKKLLLVQGQALRQQFGLNVIHLIPANLYGPGDDFNLDTCHVIPALIRKIYQARQEKKPTVEIWGTGKPTREFLYVEDCAKAVVQALEVYNAPEPVNIPGRIEISISGLCTTIAGIMNYTGAFIYENDKPDGQLKRAIDGTRCIEQLQYRPDTMIIPGLKATIDWFIQHEAER